MDPLATRGDVVCRRATAADLEGIVALLRDDPLGATRESADAADYAAAFAAIDADRGQLLLVLDRAGDVVGTLQLTFIPGLSHRGATRAQIEAVRVRQDLRGQGTGSWFVQVGVDEARRRGCAMVQLTSNATRTQAIRFYQRLGFVASHSGLKLPL